MDGNIVTAHRLAENTFFGPIDGRCSRIDHTIVPNDVAVDRSIVLKTASSRLQKINVDRPMDHVIVQTVFEYDMYFNNVPRKPRFSMDKLNRCLRFGEGRAELIHDVENALAEGSNSILQKILSEHNVDSGFELLIMAGPAVSPGMMPSLSLRTVLWSKGSWEMSVFTSTLAFVFLWDSR